MKEFLLYRYFNWVQIRFTPPPRDPPRKNKTKQKKHKNKKRSFASFLKSNVDWSFLRVSSRHLHKVNQGAQQPGVSLKDARWRGLKDRLPPQYDKNNVTSSDVLPGFSSKALVRHVEVFYLFFFFFCFHPSFFSSRASCDVLSCGRSSALTVTLWERVCVCVSVCACQQL